ncbi:NAD-dependent epimerase/dehydratase family protein [Pseudomonas sp. S60]|nr:NAD-dependent epimerase/dehydratase family protein [Pseudomonas sp. S60]
MVDVQIVGVDYFITCDCAVDGPLKTSAEAVHLWPYCEAQCFTDLPVVRLLYTRDTALVGEAIDTLIDAD